MFINFGGHTEMQHIVPFLPDLQHWVIEYMDSPLLHMTLPNPLTMEKDIDQYMKSILAT